MTMNFIITPYVQVCAVSALLSIIVMIMAWRRKTLPGGRILFYLMVTVFFWTAGYAMEYGTVGITGKVFWAKVEYIGVVTSPVFFFLLAIEFSPYHYYLTKRNVAILFIIPLAMYLLALTNEWHQLIWTGYEEDLSGNNLYIFHHGIAFWLGVVGYSYFLMFSGTVLLIWLVIRSPSASLYQPVILILSVSAPWLGNILYISGRSPLPGLELTPIMLVLSGSLLTWNLFRINVYELVPVARGTLIETMPDGMLVLDDRLKIVDFNPAAQALLGAVSQIAIGEHAITTFAEFQSVLAVLQDDHAVYKRHQIVLETGNKNYIELSFSPIHIAHRGFHGRLIILRDISMRKLFEEEIKYANERLRAQLDEIEELQASLKEQVIRDSLTGLFNRRYLDETLEREFARAQRSGKSFCICMLDIDHFKEFNDTYGHIAGDAMLQHLGNILSLNTRLGDIVCRYGGEEFIIVIPDMQAGMAGQRIEHLRGQFETTPVVHDGKSYFATFSGGVAAYPEHGDEVNDVVTAADQALYAAKSNGRNCIIVA